MRAFQPFMAASQTPRSTPFSAAIRAHTSRSPPQSFIFTQSSAKRSSEIPAIGSKAPMRFCLLQGVRNVIPRIGVFDYSVIYFLRVIRLHRLEDEIVFALQFNFSSLAFDLYSIQS